LFYETVVVFLVAAAEGEIFIFTPDFGGIVDTARLR
jgi:hypothetical protein